MKKILFVLIFGLFTAQLYALSATTVGGGVACLRKVWIEDMIKFVSAQDINSFQVYLNNDRCIILKKGIKVTIMESPGFFGSVTGFIFQGVPGVKLWTTREQLENMTVD